MKGTLTRKKKKSGYVPGGGVRGMRTHDPGAACTWDVEALRSVQTYRPVIYIRGFSVVPRIPRRRNDGCEFGAVGFSLLVLTRIC